MKQPVFPCQTIPAEPAKARLLGLYPQRQAGLWMQRVRVPGGRLTAAQWRALAGIVRQYTPSEPLHLTTRQDVELHGLTAEPVPAVQAELAEAGLSGLGACGDTIRNVTVCPCSGLAPGRPDLDEFARELTAALLAQPGVYALPRKFKVALACGDSCGQPWINDLGLTAVEHEGAWAFRAVVAGSLGPRPGLGIPLDQVLSPRDALPLAVAALEVFNAHGDRQHRHRARLRHARERLGDETFLRLLHEAFERNRVGRDWPAPAVRTAGRTFAVRRDVAFLNGDVWPATAEGIADLCDRPDVQVRITNHHQLACFGEDSQRLEALLAAAGLRATRLRIVACPGTRWCSRGLAPCHELAGRLRERLGETDADVLVAVSGCPNGCAQSAVADVGLIGLLDGPAAQKRPVWNVLAGGGHGRDGRLSQTIAQRMGSDEAVQLVVERVRAHG